MIANANTSAATMKRALAHTITALSTASELDFDRSDEDRAFFASKKPALEQLFERLTEAIQALEAHNLKDGLQQQVRVELGDVILDRALSKAKAWIKVMLRDKSPDSASFVFGDDIGKLIRAEIKSQPYQVLECLQRLASVPDFDNKNGIAADLEKRANQQIANLQARDMGQVKYAELQSKIIIIIGEAANFLYQLNHELLLRFPRDRDYAYSFFTNVTSKRRKDDDELPTETAK
jgi:hypothetical protein